MDEEINISLQRNLSYVLFHDIFTNVFDVNANHIYSYKKIDTPNVNHKEKMQIIKPPFRICYHMS